jgi:hypothetical protein
MSFGNLSLCSFAEFALFSALIFLVNLLLNSHSEFTRICVAWKTDTWLWLRIFLADMVIYQVE